MVITTNVGDPSVNASRHVLSEDGGNGNGTREWQTGSQVISQIAEIRRYGSDDAMGHVVSPHF